MRPCLVPLAALTSFCPRGCSGRFRQQSGQQSAGRVDRRQRPAERSYCRSGDPRDLDRRRPRPQSVCNRVARHYSLAQRAAPGECDRRRGHLLEIGCNRHAAGASVGDRRGSDMKSSADFIHVRDWPITSLRRRERFGRFRAQRRRETGCLGFIRCMARRRGSRVRSDTLSARRSAGAAFPVRAGAI